jgi:N-methylhydantoinase B
MLDGNEGRCERMDGGIDPIVAQIIINRLAAIPNLVDKDITRTAFSQLVSEYKDYAVGLVDPDGLLISQCKGGLPIFIANALSAAVRDGLRIYGKRRLQEGDVVITNYAGTMGQHLNNVVMYTPIRSGEDDAGLVGFSAVVMHWVDVGGMVVGSCFSNDATDIFQEGIQFHTVKLLSRGERVEEIYRMVAANTRFPDLVLGDLASQVAGCLMGRDLVRQVVADFGSDRVRAATLLQWDRSDQAVRKLIAGIPNGTYRASSFLDDDPQVPGVAMLMEVSVIVADETITVDLSGLPPQAQGPVNAGYEGGAVAAARIACKYVFCPDEPANEGAFRPIAVHCPPGRMLSAAPTAAMGGSGNAIPTVVDTILRAMAGLLPARVPAGHHGTYGLHVIYGRSAATGRWFQHMESTIGGWGAGQGWDGPGPFRSMAHGDTMEVPVELQEAEHPYRIDYVRLRPDSGGPGRWRGGLGVEKQYTILTDCRIGTKIERTRCRPWGVNGGGEGEPGRVVVRRDGAAPITLLKGDVALQPGDRVEIHTGGGGGWGDPAQRDMDALNHDFAMGYVTCWPAPARTGSGV